MKRILLATSALAALAGSSQAQAASDMYVSVFGGANWYDDNSQLIVAGPSQFLDFDMDADTGFVLGGAIGAGLDNWVKGLDVELEVSYRRQDVGGVFQTSSGHTHSGTIDGNQSTFAVMANVWYEINTGWKVRPYVGGGVGWARSSMEFLLTSSSGPDTSTDENSGFAWQLGLGFNYEVAQDVDVGLGYRYLQAPRNIGAFTGNHQTYVTPLENDNHSVMVNLTIGIN